MVPNSSLSAAILLVVLALNSGCSNRPESHRYVSGTVLMANGQPLTGLKGPAVLRFDPADEELRESYESIAMIQDDGTFEVMTYEGGDGVPMGSYKVVLTMEKFEENYEIVPDVYTHYETTPWLAEVTADGENAFTLQISTDPPKSR